jgi:hypothetical protein
VPIGTTLISRIAIAQSPWFVSRIIKIYHPINVLSTT